MAEGDGSDTAADELLAVAQLAAIVESSDDAIIGKTLDGVITSWNRGAERMYGYAREEVLGQNVSLIVPEDRRDELEQILERVRAGESAAGRATRRVCKDGSVIDVFLTVSAIRDADGQVVGSSAITRDITETGRAARALGESEARKAAILRSSLDALITIDVNGVVIEFNPAAERLFGYTSADVIGQPLAELIIPPQYREAHRAGLRRYLATGDGPILGHRLEFTALRADGSEFAVELTVTRVDMPDAELFTAALRDISEQRRLQRELNQTQRLESLGRLAGGVAHDFNNLLGVIINYAVFIAEQAADHRGDGDWSSIAHDADEIRQAGERATRLTRQLLAFARRELVRPEVLDCNRVITDVEELLQRTLGEHIELQLDLADDVWPVLADPGQLEQVLVNLAVNARDALPSGGQLTIETMNTTVDERYARLHPDVAPGRYVCLLVSDTGTGMNSEIAERAFEPFFTTKRPGEGTGLGLATVYGIVHQAGGHIFLDSDLGVGTTVNVLLPISTATSPITSRAPKDTMQQVLGRGETVLVVEDEDAIRAVVERILRQSHYEVLTAAHADDALTLARDHASIDVLLTDVIMPGMSGRELATELRSVLPNVKVLYMSGYALPALATQGTLDADVDLVEKPFSATTLLRALRQVLDIRG